MEVFVNEVLRKYLRPTRVKLIGEQRTLRKRNIVICTGRLSGWAIQDSDGGPGMQL
jgi:hypothetical protein